MLFLHLSLSRMNASRNSKVCRAFCAQSAASSNASRDHSAHAEPRHLASGHAAPERRGAGAVPHGGQAAPAVPGSVVERARPAAALLACGRPPANGSHAAPAVRARDADPGHLHERARLRRALQALRPGQVSVLGGCCNYDDCFVVFQSHSMRVGRN